MGSTYAFTGSWVLAAAPDRVRAELVDLEHYPDWWPQVLAVASLGPDDARVLCRSRLPYTLDLVLHAVSRSEDWLEVAVSGDLEGSVSWRLSRSDRGTRLDFDQSVVAPGLLGAITPLARPVLRWNHDQMMRGCLAGLRARVAS